MYSIPYTAEKPTYLFREMNRTAIQLQRFAMDKIHAVTDFKTLQLYDKHSTNLIVRSRVVSSNNSSYTFQSGVFRNKMFESDVFLCPKLISEEVRIWCEYPFLFIWSCVEGKIGEIKHEEALLILEKYSKEAKEQEELLEVAQNFLSADLLALIDLGHHIELHDGLAERSFSCPVSSLEMAPYFLIVILVVLILAVGHYWYFKKEEDV